MRMQNMKKGENTEQMALFVWAGNNAHVLPCLSLMYHVPNEGKRTNGAVLKAMGLKSGVPDVCLPVASHNFHGLYLEMKYGRNKATPEQEAFMAGLRQQGYKTAVCHGTEEAKAEILDYLQEPGKMPLVKCLNAPRIDGKCERHTPTRAESTINANMAAVDEYFKMPIIKTIADLSTRKPLKNMTLEDALETINKNLAFLVTGKQLTVEQSAAVLTVAVDAYGRAKEGGRGDEEKDGRRT